MTHKTSARIAGSTFLLYIAAGITSLMVFGRVTSGEGIAAKLSGIAQHPTDVGVVVMLDLFQCFAALVLAVTLYGLTREQDPDLAMLALTCRVSEGVIGGASMPATLGLLWLATTTDAKAPDIGAAHGLAAFMFKVDASSPLIAATFFAVGSMLF